MSLTEEDRALIEGLAQDLQSFAVACDDARHWGGPTIYPANPITEDRARLVSKALIRLLSAAREEARTQPQPQDGQGEAVAWLIEHRNALRHFVREIRAADDDWRVLTAEQRRSADLLLADAALQAQTGEAG